MKQKRIFKRQKERHPFKWFAIVAGLAFLSFASFGAGVQFATLTIDPAEVQLADTEETTAADATPGAPLRVAHTPQKDT